MQARLLAVLILGGCSPHLSSSPIPDIETMLITSEKDAKPTQIPPLNAELTDYGFPQGYFMLRSAGTGRVLDVFQGLKEDGTPIILWPATETSLVECEQRTVLIA